MTLLALLPLNFALGQTTVFYDDFNRISITPGGIPEMTYTATNNSSTGSPVIESASLTGTVPYLKLVGYTTALPTAGETFMTGPLSAFSSPFNSTLSSNTGDVSWSVNLRESYNGATGSLSSTGRFVGIVLVASEADLLSSTCKGYAIAQSNTSLSGYQLVKFSNGLGTGGTVTPIISAQSNFLGNNRDWVSVKVTYNPASNNWTLYERVDAVTGSPAWADPTTTSTVIGSTTMDNTHTGIAMSVFGYFLNHPANSTTFNLQLDNFTVIVTPNVTPALVASPTTLTAFNYSVGSATSPSQTFNINGVNLTGTGNISISGSTNYEVSADNVSFGPTALIPYTSSTLTSTPIYVRLKSGLSASYYNSEIIACSGGGASATNVSCSGMVVPATPNTYTWTGVTSTDWQVSSNWSPTRTTSFPNDILQFNNGGSVVATNLPTQTIAQLLISNSTAVEFQSAATATLTINGDAGIDLSVAAGSSLNIIQATNIITLALNTGATGSISGSMTYNTAAHKLTAVDASAITFQNGATFTAGSTFSGNVFGTTALNSVVFASGSTYICQGGGNPFGASQPTSVVVFQTGSLYKHKTATAPSIGGRVYANFEFDLTSGVCSGTSAVILNLDNLTVTSGTLNFGLTTNGINIKGNISVASGATLNFNPATAGSVDIKGDLTIASGGTLNFNPTVTESVSFSGTNIQTINNNGTIVNGTGATISVTNSNPLIYNINNGATLSTLGAISGAVNYNYFNLSPAGSSTGTFNLSGSPIDLSGTLNMQITNVSNADKLTAANGTTLDISKTAIVVTKDASYSPLNGDMISLVNIPSGFVTGAFESVSLPGGSAPLHWRLIYTTNDVSMIYDMGTGISTQTIPNAYVSFGKLIMYGGDVYNCIGLKVASVNNTIQKTELSLKPGVYLLKTSNSIQKVLIK